MKGVDALHMSNHVRETCKKDYPKVLADLKSTFESPNTEGSPDSYRNMQKTS